MMMKVKGMQTPGGMERGRADDFVEGMMTTVAQMTRDELRELIETTIEHKLLELFGDPDAGLPIRKAVRDRLIRQQQAVARGERGESFEEVVRRLGLES